MTGGGISIYFSPIICGPDVGGLLGWMKVYTDELGV